MRKFILNEDDSNEIYLYRDKKTGNIYYYDGTKLVLIDSSAIKRAEEKIRNQNDITNETEEDREKRIADANAAISDEKTIERGLSQAKSAAYKSRRNYEKNKKEKEQQAASLSGYDSISSIQLSIKDFIKSQIKEKTSYSYSKFNKKYNNVTGGVIKPGKFKEQSKNVPTINVYFDQSGSWSSEDIEKGNKIISVLKEYVDKKQLKVNLFYFNNSVFSTPLPKGRGGTQGEPVMKHILSTRPDNVIIMTDSDTSSQDLSKAVVPGAVWFLWKEGYKSIALRNSLAGKKLTKEFNLG